MHQLNSGYMPDKIEDGYFLSQTMDKILTRIEARITPETKALIQQAADIESSTLADFLSRSAQAAAQKTIANHNVLKLNAEDSRAFVEAILNPKEPNDALKQAMRRHQQEFGNVS